MVQTEYNNPIRQQVFLTPGMAELTLKDSFGGAMETLLQLDEIRSTRKVILTGAGDSYAAALAMLPAFGDLCQAIDASVMRLIEFTRFTPLERLGLNRPEELLVVVISAGGKGESNRSRVSFDQRKGGQSGSAGGKACPAYENASASDCGYAGTLQLSGLRDRACGAGSNAWSGKRCNHSAGNTGLL